VPALLERARSAHRRGDAEQASAALDEAAALAPQAALALRARFLLDDDQNADALALLKDAMAKAPLPPAALRSLIEAAGRSGIRLRRSPRCPHTRKPMHSRTPILPSSKRTRSPRHWRMRRAQTRWRASGRD